MNNRIKHFLIGSMVFVFIICIVVFTALSIYLNAQNENTITQLGNIYMSSMNERISKHFESITDHRLVQMKSMIEIVPPEYREDEEALHEWIVYNGKARGYASISYFCGDGSLKMIYGGEVSLLDSDEIFAAMKSGDGKVAVGFNSEGDKVFLVCVPISFDISGTDDCIALVGELPLSYISDTLSLEEDDSLI